MSRLDAAVWIFTAIRPSLKDLTAPWPNACFDTEHAVEMRLPVYKRSTEWVARLPAVVKTLNNEVTQLTGEKPAEAIKKKTVSAKPSTPNLRPVGVHEKKADFRRECSLSIPAPRT